MASILEAFLAGKEARRVADAAEQVNAMNAFLSQNGQAIFAGDQNALGQLAGMGPQGLQTALSVKGNLDAQQRQAMLDAQAAEDRAYNRERDQKQDSRADQEWEMQMAEYTKSLTAEQAAAEAAKIEEAVKMGLMVQTPEEWDQMVTQAGAPDLVGQFENRDAIAARFMSIAEVLKSTNPEGPAWRVATPEEAARYGASSGQINTKTGEFEKTGEGNGITQTIRNPDGSETVIQIGGAGGAGGKPFTEAQSKDNVFATRASGALEKLESPIDPNNPDGPVVADALTSLQDNMATGVPVVGNYLTGEGFQVAETAGDEFLQAILRKDTGAAITAQEQALYGKTYLPQPGDSKERLKYKKEARKRAVEAIKAGMSAEQLEAKARAEAAAMDGTAPAEAAPKGEVKRLKFNPETGELE